MAFVIYLPLGHKTPRTLSTSNALVPQLLQEFVILRHLKETKNVATPKAIAPWIDQAKTYFLDAVQADWRSSGLLYYYSFLNLSKAFLVAKRYFTFRSLNTTSIYHGLTADQQSVKNFIDFEFKIFPPQQSNRNNVFSSFYEAVTKEDWPFSDTITIKVADIAGYCLDISAELWSLYRVEQKIFIAQSLLRRVKNHVWFEMLVPQGSASVVKEHFPSWPLKEIKPSDFSAIDNREWLLLLRRTAASLRYHICLRTDEKLCKEKNVNEVYNLVANEAKNHLEPYVLPTVYEQAYSPQWLFIPNLNLLGKSIKWHPLFSDYLVAFVLSTILRYQPQLLELRKHNLFLAEAWCSQSPVTALRYFLMLFTRPPLRIETY